MKINLKKNLVAILKEESGEVVGVFKATPYANGAMMAAVANHFDVEMVGMNTFDTDRDFNPPLDYEQPYEFVLYKGGGEEEYVTLIMTYSFLY